MKNLEMNTNLIIRFAAWVTKKKYCIRDHHHGYDRNAAMGRGL